MVPKVKYLRKQLIKPKLANMFVPVVITQNRNRLLYQL